MPVPLDLQPVFRNLASLVGPRDTRHHSLAQPKLGGRSRRNTVAAANVPSQSDTDSDSDSDDEESVAKFPLGKQYAFTFKMMLHKLYELEEWGKKVQQVLENSQSEFQSLADAEGRKQKEVKEEEREAGKGDGRVRFAAGVNTGGRRKGNAPMTRPRSVSVSGTMLKVKDSPTRDARMQQPRIKFAEPRDDIRVVKKRCVGRRKSLNGLTGDGIGKIGGWVYDSAIASIEGTGQGSVRRRRVSLVTSAAPGPLQVSTATPRKKRAMTVSDLSSPKEVRMMKRRLGV